MILEAQMLNLPFLLQFQLQLLKILISKQKRKNQRFKLNNQKLSQLLQLKLKNRNQ
jgi:hypothetical protein